MAAEYLALTPDVNAARIEGPGESSLLAGGAAMTALGTAVATAAATVSASVSTLAASGWTGPSGLSTAASFAPNVAWMSEHAAKCATIGAKHVAFAEAYRTANLMIPKVPVVAENQAEHMALQASNILGINGLPIAINRGVYQAYWTAAGSAMNAFESVGTMASTPIPAEPPPPITSMGIGMLSSAISTGVSAGVGLAQGAMQAATTGLGAMTGAGSAAAGAVAPAAAQAAGTSSGGVGANGQAGSPGTAGKADGGQLTSLLSSAPQALGQIPQALGSLPQGATQALSGPTQALMGPLQSMMSGGSGLGGGAPMGAGMNGLSGMYPGGLANAGESGGRSASSSGGLTRSAGLGGGSYATPSGWRSPADTLGIGAAPASAMGSGRAVAGGADLRTSGSGSGMGPMMGPMSSVGGNRGRGMRGSAPLSWEEDPFGAEEEDDLPMMLSSGERGT